MSKWKQVWTSEELNAHGFLGIFSGLMMVASFMFLAAFNGEIAQSINSAAWLFTTALALTIANSVTSHGGRRLFSGIGYFFLVFKSCLWTFQGWGYNHAGLPIALGIAAFLATLIWGFPSSFATGALMGFWGLIIVGFFIHPNPLKGMFTQYDMAFNSIWGWVLVGLFFWYVSKKYEDIKSSIRQLMFSKKRKKIIAKATKPVVIVTTEEKTETANTQPSVSSPPKTVEKDRTVSEDVGNYQDFLRPRRGKAKELLRNYSQK